MTYAYGVSCMHVSRPAYVCVSNAAKIRRYSARPPPCSEKIASILIQLYSVQKSFVKQQPLSRTHFGVKFLNSINQILLESEGFEVNVV